MSQTEQMIEWFLARDGKQHGPISDVEMRKFVELGHLRASDLVWRQGMPDWMPAPQVFPPAPPAPPPPRPPMPSGGPPRGPMGHDARSAGHPGQGAGGLVHPSGPLQRQAVQAGPGVGPQAPRGPQAARPAGPAPQSSGPVLQVPETAAASRHGSAPVGLDLDEPPRRGISRMVVVVVLLLSVLVGSAAALVMTGRLSASSIPFLSGAAKSSVPVVKAPREAAKQAAAPSSPTVPAIPAAAKPPAAATAPPAAPPAAPAVDHAAAVDQRLQRSAVWKLVKRDHPAWYATQVAAVAKLVGDGRSDAEVATHLARAGGELRRDNVNAALAAGPDRIRKVAMAFVESLASLEKQSVAACYGYISQGEASPAMAGLIGNAEQMAVLEAQQRSVLEAIADGRNAAKPGDPPQREDYDVLAAELGRIGWSVTDLQTFSDARALSRAPPAQVCKMVQDWFKAQLGIKDQPVQLRLLRESLKPVVAG